MFWEESVASVSDRLAIPRGYGESRMKWISNLLAARGFGGAERNERVRKTREREG